MYYKREKDLPPMPDWMKWSMVLFVAYLAFTGYQGEKSEDPERPNLKKYPAITEFADVDRWYRYANPGYNRRMEYEEVAEGLGDFAACGQTVTLNIEATEPEDAVRSPELNPKDPVVFTIGHQSVYEAWDRGVRGMRLGGKRKIHVGSRLIDKSQKEMEASDYVFHLSLVDIVPRGMAGGLTQTFSVMREGGGIPISCGELGLFSYVVRDVRGTVLFDAADSPILLRLGYSELGHGMDRGLVGMMIGEIRRLIVPSHYFPEKSDIPFPKDEMVIVEVIRVAYNEEKSEPVTIKESDHESDSQSTERNQTIPNDGGDGQSSGAEGGR